MTKKWVRATETVTVSEKGRLAHKHPGDVFAVNNMRLRELLQTRQVELIGPSAGTSLRNLYNLMDCGIAVVGSMQKARKILKRNQYNLDMANGRTLAFSRTLLWQPDAHLRLDLIPVGFHRLTAGWQIAAPLWRYQKLARDIGSAEDRAKTKAVIHDLRVPVYETGCMYIRRCAETRRLMRIWKREMKGGGDEKLAFMRALYITKCVICALPTTWV